MTAEVANTFCQAAMIAALPVPAQWWLLLQTQFKKHTFSGSGGCNTASSSPKVATAATSRRAACELGYRCCSRGI